MVSILLQLYKKTLSIKLATIILITCSACVRNKAMQTHCKRTMYIIRAYCVHLHTHTRKHIACIELFQVCQSVWFVVVFFPYSVKMFLHKEPRPLTFYILTFIYKFETKRSRFCHLLHWSISNWFKFFFQITKKMIGFIFFTGLWDIAFCKPFHYVKLGGFPPMK